MPHSVIIGPIQTIAGSGDTIMGRIQGNEGQYITQDDITSISATCTRESGEQTASDVALDKTTVVFDVPVADEPRWDKDNIGPNFIAALPAEWFPEADWYEVMVTFTPTGGEVWKSVWAGPVRSGI